MYYSLWEARGMTEGMSVLEMSKSLGLRLGTCYGLLREGIVAAAKSETGQWLVDRDSVELYRLRRTIRRPASRAALRRDAIDVNVSSQVADSA